MISSPNLCFIAHFRARQRSVKINVDDLIWDTHEIATFQRRRTIQQNTKNTLFGRCASARNADCSRDRDYKLRYTIELNHATSQRPLTSFAQQQNRIYSDAHGSRPIHTLDVCIYSRVIRTQQPNTSHIHIHTYIETRACDLRHMCTVTAYRHRVALSTNATFVSNNVEPNAHCCLHIVAFALILTINVALFMIQRSQSFEEMTAQRWPFPFSVSFLDVFIFFVHVSCVVLELCVHARCRSSMTTVPWNFSTFDENKYEKKSAPKMLQLHNLLCH